VGVQVTVFSMMAARRSLWGVGWSRTTGECGMVVTKDMRPSLHVLGAAIGVPNVASAGSFQVCVCVLPIVISVELKVEISERQ